MRPDACVCGLPSLNFPSFSVDVCQVNVHGTPGNLVPAHPGNTNAVRHGVHSPRLIQARASEIEADLAESYTFTPTQLLALHEAARCLAILDAIDMDLDERGLVDKRGKPRYLLNHRYRFSRQLDQWLTKISETIERQAAAEKAESPPTRKAYIRELQRVALGEDSAATVRDRLLALRELLKLGNEAAAKKASIPDYTGFLPGVQVRFPKSPPNQSV